MRLREAGPERCGGEVPQGRAGGKAVRAGAEGRGAAAELWRTLAASRCQRPPGVRRAAAGDTLPPPNL